MEAIAWQEHGTGPTFGHMDSHDEPLIRDQQDQTVILRLNRPDRLNAVNLPMYAALESELRGLIADREVRALMITGSGRAFCVGADLKAHGEGGEGELSLDERKGYVDAGQRVHRLLQTIPKPVVAAVNGHAIGAGLELALSCDFIIVAEDAKLRLPEIGLGTFVGGGATYTLAQRVGYTKAKELIMLGLMFYGKEAEAMGLANAALPADAVLEAASELAAELSRKAPISMAFAKRLLDRARDVDSETALRLEARALLQCMETRDWREGIDAFNEKRDPNFIGE